jgi:CheY-like chemotaxis protein
VLLAEDDEFNQEVVRHLLVRGGHSVHIVANGRQALAAVQGSQRFDVMLLDVQMPELDGFQVIKAIRETERGTERRLAVVALTAMDGPGERERCIDAGMDHYLSKPVRMSELYAALERVGGDSSLREKEIPSTHDAESDLLDPATILATCGGDEELLREMIDLYIVGAPSRLAAVEHAVAAGDSAALRSAAHKLKGLVSPFSGKARRAVERLEQLGAQRKVAEAADALREAREDVVALISSLRGVTVTSLH